MIDTASLVDRVHKMARLIENLELEKLTVEVSALVIDYETLETEIKEDTALLNAVEALCTREKSFSYWASVAFGVKPRDVLRKILHEAKQQQHSGQHPPSSSEGSSEREQRIAQYSGEETGSAPRHEGDT